MHDSGVRDVTAWRESLIIYDFSPNVYDLVYGWLGLYKHVSSGRKVSHRPGVVLITTDFLCVPSFKEFFV